MCSAHINARLDARRHTVLIGLFCNLQFSGPYFNAMRSVEILNAVRIAAIAVRIMACVACCSRRTGRVDSTLLNSYPAYRCTDPSMSPVLNFAYRRAFLCLSSVGGQAINHAAPPLASLNAPSHTIPELLGFSYLYLQHQQPVFHRPCRPCPIDKVQRKKKIPRAHEPPTPPHLGGESRIRFFYFWLNGICLQPLVFSCSAD